MNVRHHAWLRGGIRAAFAVLAIALLAAPASAVTPFVSETVEAAGSVGGINSLVLDARGNPHISYSDITNGNLKYATRRDGVWITETVDASASQVGEYSSIDVDDQGNVHIAYDDFTGGDRDLKYARRVGGLWVIEVADAAANLVDGVISLEVDAQGNPHVSYQDINGSALKYARKVSGFWNVEVVEAANSGYYSSIALDAQGNPHISHLDSPNWNLRYSRKTTGVWISEDADASPNLVGTYTSIAIDALGNPHISYCDETQSALDLKYAHKAGGVWTTEIADAGGAVGSHTSLALDEDGVPHISYLNFGAQTLHYARKTSGVWTSELVASTGGNFTPSSIALDSQGNPHISYSDPNQGDLKYVDSSVRLLKPLGGERWATGSTQEVRWVGVGTVDIEISSDGGATYGGLLSGVTSNTVAITAPALSTEEARIRIRRDSPPSASESPAFFSIAPDLVSPWWSSIADGADNTAMGEHAALAIDVRDNPHISYYDNPNRDLKYATKSGGIWAIETVDAANNVGEFTSIALDAQGNPRISYYDASLLKPKYASKNGGIWTTEVIDPGIFGGQYTSLALDALGNPHVSYYDLTMMNGDLKYAHKAGGLWYPETVDATGNVGSFSSVAIDAQGIPHISYYDQTNSDLKYARKSMFGWTIETVQASGSAGLYSSLKLDSQGNPCIAYWDFTGFDLKYATKKAGVWSIERADEVGMVGTYSSLALDVLDNPHISYRNETPGTDDLKHATRQGGRWITETVDAVGNVGWHSSIALDSQGVPRIAHWTASNSDLRYTSAAIEMSSPVPGDEWQVGAHETVAWEGTGKLDLYLSADGGNSWTLEAAGLGGGEASFLVPHVPSRFARVKLERVVPHYEAVTPGFITIETSIALLNFVAQVDPEGGAELSWSTDPGPSELAGYRIERGSSGSYVTIVPLTRETRYHDPAGAPGNQYRLFAVNGLGEELMLGEASLLPPRMLAAWPLPYRDGELQVSFGVAGGIAGGAGRADVALYDLSGRRVKTIASGPFESGYHVVRWDGRDDRGARVPVGIYFLRSSTGGETSRIKLVVMP